MVYLDHIAHVLILKFPTTGMQNCDEPNVEICQDHKIYFKWKICKSKLSRVTIFLRFGIQILQDLPGACLRKKSKYAGCGYGRGYLSGRGIQMTGA